MPAGQRVLGKNRRRLEHIRRGIARIVGRGLPISAHAEDWLQPFTPLHIYRLGDLTAHEFRQVLADTKVKNAFLYGKAICPYAAITG